MAELPVTFREPSYVLFDADKNACLTTDHGNLAIFNVKTMAELWARASVRNLKVIAVNITPLEGQL